MNQSGIRRMRERLQARQAVHHSIDSTAGEILGGVALALFFLVILFI